MSDDQCVVRIRTRGHAYTTPPMRRPKATELRDSYRRAVHDIGDGPQLVTLVDRNGREVDIRTRDIVVIELGIDGPDDPVGEARRRRQGPAPIARGPRIPPGTYRTTDGATLTVTENQTAEEGINFLRRVADVDGSMARHPAGRSR